MSDVKDRCARRARGSSDCNRGGQWQNANARKRRSHPSQALGNGLEVNKDRREQAAAVTVKHSLAFQTSSEIDGDCSFGILTSEHGQEIGEDSQVYGEHSVRGIK